MGIDKTFEAISNKYYWPNMFKEIYAGIISSISKCATLSVVLAGTLNASGQPEYKSIKPIIYLFPDRVLGYSPLTSTPM
jgi:hypothetical protein